MFLFQNGQWFKVSIANDGVNLTLCDPQLQQNRMNRDDFVSRETFHVQSILCYNCVITSTECNLFSNQLFKLGKLSTLSQIKHPWMVLRTSGEHIIFKLMLKRSSYGPFQLNLTQTASMRAAHASTCVKTNKPHF